MTVSPKYHLIIGTTKNWQRAFQHNPPVWGFTEREKLAWERLQQGDTIYFYAAGEARGIIGKGIVLNKLRGDDPYWPEEKEKRVVVWPLRFYFRPVRLLSPDMWLAGKGPIHSRIFDVPGIKLQRQILPLGTTAIAKIESMLSTWTTVSVGYSQSEEETAAVQEVPVVPYQPLSHAGLVKILEEIASLQNFYPQTEFLIPGENRRIDIIWRREVRGTPTYAFEVELSGGIDKAIHKLYKCFRLWSTLPRVIIPSPEIEKVRQIASDLEKKFEQSIVSIAPEQIRDLLSKKKAYKDIEAGLGLL